MLAKNGKAPVPWKKLNKDPQPFVNAEYLPDGFKFDDPMHILKPELLEVFSHWEERLAAGETVFEFKAVSHDHRGMERLDIYRRLSSVDTDQELLTKRVTPGVDEQTTNEEEEAEKDQEDSEAEQEADGSSGNIQCLENSEVTGGNQSSGRRTVVGKANGEVASNRSATSNQQVLSHWLAPDEQAVAGSSRHHRNGVGNYQRIGHDGIQQNGIGLQRAAAGSSRHYRNSNPDTYRIGIGSFQWISQGASRQSGIAADQLDTVQKGTSRTISVASMKTLHGHNTSHQEMASDRHTWRDDDDVDEDENELHPVTLLFPSY